jgi:hypothetical protein
MARLMLLPCQINRNLAVAPLPRLLFSRFLLLAG